LSQKRGFSVRKVLLKGEYLFYEGDKAKYFYILRRGRVKMSRASEEGKEHVLHVLFPGSLIGEMVMFGRDIYPANCLALEDTVVEAFATENFSNFIKSCPEQSFRIMRSQAKKLREFAFKLELMSLCNTRQKVIRYFERHSHEGQVCLNMKLHELASYLGVSREGLSRSMSALNKEGIIKKKGKEWLLKRVLD
jgi:CRP-like cAMP-binding protein